MKNIFNLYDWNKTDIIDVFNTSCTKREEGTEIKDRCSTDKYQLGIKFSGLTKVWYDGESFDSCGGSALYLPKEKSADIDYRRKFIKQSEGICIFFDSDRPLPPKPILIEHNSSDVEKLSLRLSSAYNAPDKSMIEYTGLFYNILTLLEKSLASRNGAGETDAAIEYMKEHVRDSFVDWNVPAKILGVTPDYMRHKFKSVYGISLLQYYNRLKINYIKGMLCRGEDSMSDIAKSAGFSDLNYFSRFFKKHTGVSPSEYRRRYYNMI